MEKRSRARSQPAMEIQQYLGVQAGHKAPAGGDAIRKCLDLGCYKVRTLGQRKNDQNGVRD